MGSKGNVGQCIYSASKAGLEGFTKSLAKEVAAKGIRANVIAPGNLVHCRRRHRSSQMQDHHVPFLKVKLPAISTETREPARCGQLATARPKVLCRIAWGHSFCFRQIGLSAGYIRTDMTSDGKYDDKIPVTQIPLRRTGEPHEVAELASFLTEATYITGQVGESHTKIYHTLKTTSIQEM